MRSFSTIAVALLVVVLSSVRLSALTVNDFNAGLEGWRFDFGGPASITFDPAQGSPGNLQGAAKMVFNFPYSGGMAFTNDAFFPGQNLTAEGTLRFDVMVDPSSAHDAFGAYGYLDFVSREGDTYAWGNQTGRNLPSLPGVWQTFTVPTTAGGAGGLGMSNTRAFTLQLYGGPAQNISGPVTLWLDNVRTGPDLTATTLFSWETPDNPSTPSVNEQFEGWKDGFAGEPYQHTRTITTTGATNGTKALQIASPQSGFAWGSQFELDSGVGGDPANQPQIHSLVQQVNSAEKLAFDVTFPASQPFGLAPSYLSLFLSITDQSGAFYQTPAQQAGSPIGLAGQTVTIEIPMSSFSTGTANLGNTDLVDGTYIRFALATNSDDGATFIIDNFRLLSLPGVPGDYNGDGAVNAADYVLYRKGGPLQNEVDTPGTVNAADYAAWRARFGNPSGGGAGVSLGSAVPEPTNGCLLLAGVLAGLVVRSRGDFWGCAGCYTRR